MGLQKTNNFFLFFHFFLLLLSGLSLISLDFKNYEFEYQINERKAFSPCKRTRNSIFFKIF